ncbi:zinc finger and BTB domain-containing protein 22 [Anolis carolinensis]|uniref:zinc finger and BTB domain-containing protein 22 n=1 Tax=Anolis carolinensis TaxID=28377 RepID=UPI002F2B1755
MDSSAAASSSSSSAGPLSVVHVAFPEVTGALLESLNQQRLEGKLCDIAIQVQGRVFRAHRAVLAASSPYFHDQVLLKNMTSVVLPSVMDPVAFEAVLGSAYTGHLSMAADEIVNFLTVGSVLQMWHIVDKCTELLKERRGALLLGSAAAPSSSLAPSSSSSSLAPSSSSFRAHSSRTSENQSPSSSNYFSPRDSSGEGGPSEVGKYHPRGGPLLGGEREASEDHEEEITATVVFPGGQKDPFGGGGSSKFILEMEDDEGSDGGEPGCSVPPGGSRRPPLHRPAYLRPSIVPQRQWVFVKKERPQEDLVLTCEEEDEDPVEEVEVGPGAPESAGLSITDVRTLTGPGGKLEEQVNFCESSEDFPSPYEAALQEEAGALGLGALGLGGSSSGAAASSSSSFPGRGASLLPMDMQGNHVVLFPAGSGPAAGASLAASTVEHGAVQLASGSGGDGNKIFMCHCGKAFSHKSMRDRHVNMHLNLRPFDCPVCNKKFKMKHHLTEHMKTHTGLKPYECDVCAKKFMWRDSFMRHKGHCERRHRLGPPGSAGPPGGGGGAKKEGSPSPMSAAAEAEWGGSGSGPPGKSPRSELGFAPGSSKM